MFGNLSFLNRKVSEDQLAPIHKPVGGIDTLRITATINDEMWREILRRKQFTHTNIIQVPGLGSFTTRMSPLKKYIYTSIRQLRRLRVRMQKLKEANPDIDPKTSMTFLMHDDLVKKVKAAWGQLEELRKIIILRTIVWNAKLRLRGQEDKIKVDYKPSDYLFIQEYIKDKKTRIV